MGDTFSSEASEQACKLVETSLSFCLSQWQLAGAVKVVVIGGYFFFLQGSIGQKPGVDCVTGQRNQPKKTRSTHRHGGHERNPHFDLH